MYWIEEGNGPAVLLLHGQPGHGENFRPVINYIKNHSSVFAPDRPGYGRSKEPAAGVFYCARILAKELRDKGLDELTVVGHSYGGAVALALAESNPELVRNLVLLAPAGTRSSIDDLDKLLTLKYIGELVALGGLLSIDYFLPWLKRNVEDTWLPTFAEEKLKYLLRHTSSHNVSTRPIIRTLSTFMVEQRAIVAEIGALESSLHKIKVPVQVVSGSQDDVVKPEASKELSELLKYGRFELIEGAGHLLLSESTLRVADYILSALRSN